MSHVLSCRSISGSKDGCQLASLLQERRVDGFLRFLRLGRLTAEGKNREREQTRPLEQVAWWHIGERVQGECPRISSSSAAATVT